MSNEHPFAAALYKSADWVYCKHMILVFLKNVAATFGIAFCNKENGAKNITPCLRLLLVQWIESFSMESSMVRLF
jgi:hypothetical protein